MHGAVILPCQHSFCSLCIRRLISNNMSCPICKRPVKTSNIRPNIELQNKILLDKKCIPPPFSECKLHRLSLRQYKTMKAAKIKEELRQFGIDCTGKKEDLVKWHREYCLRYNAEFDAVDRLTPMEIAKIIMDEIADSKTEKLKERKRTKDEEKKPRKSEEQDKYHQTVLMLVAAIKKRKLAKLATIKSQNQTKNVF
ncbi:hypothetical protein EIN_153900 [Entamoeba invadens IP1]|uniref:Postreplication repair E3 ubiquitin-protein ligase RAD18 n=1 Tax=Entamoeba invadens IP1 TaxID=370355 RepID=A0A0A1UCE2_ENTIV|nr:hypothetical protein EIN_153900 [Entamoeba invadens IP1]ELP91353.1 hypothetical protein EIN_153900 [Entamoeba invadens IP1]|eukprot:XP_004258124.1 hypothetical protein EIN_153900 [Entamoeba invadens IP1]